MFLFKNSTKETIPPSYLKTCPLSSSLSSVIAISSPLFKNASSLNLLDKRSKLNSISSHFDYLSTISIKELENTPLNSSEIGYLLSVGEEIARIASYSEWIDEEYVSQADDRMAIVADVHTDPNSGQVLEVGTGNPFTIYVVVQDANGNLRLTRGGTFSYYEFTYPMENRLTDEEWHSLLDNDSPSLPDWLTTSLPIYVQDTTAVLVVLNKES